MPKVMGLQSLPNKLFFYATKDISEVIEKLAIMTAAIRLVLMLIPFINRSLSKLAMV